MVFKSSIGEEVELGLPHMKNLGLNLGELHLELQRVKNLDRPKFDKRHLMDEPLEIIKRFLPEDSADFRFLEQIITSIKPELDYKGAQGIIHGDLHSLNVHFDKKDQPSIIDFDCCGYGLLNFDLAVVVFFTTLVGFRNDDTMKLKLEKLDAFFEGYNVHRKLNELDHKNIWRLVLARHIWQLGILAGKAKFTDEEGAFPDLFYRANKITKEWMKYFKIEL